MAPAFSSPRQAAAFALLLLVTLLSPIWVGKWALAPREEVYASVSFNSGDYPFIHQEIFEKKADIDIAFMGSSHMYNDIDTIYVQKELSKRLGRPAVVVSLCWRWSGIDQLFFTGQDLLQHRKVHMIVIEDERGPNEPHAHAWQLVRFGDNWQDLQGLPLGKRLAYYYGMVMGMPRNLFSLFWSDLPPDLKPEMIQFLKWRGDIADVPGLPTAELGAEVAQVNYDLPGPFAAYLPRTGAQPADTCVYSAATASQFDFTGPPAAPLQTYFARKIAKLARLHGTRLVCLNLPRFDNGNAPKIPAGRLWPDTLRPDSDLVGISPRKLFNGLGDESLRRLFGDSIHLNENGEHYFTLLITPSLLQLYAPANP